MPDPIVSHSWTDVPIAGNGTQSIAWQINEETYRNSLEDDAVEGEVKPKLPGLKVYYGSIHDILSFPCEVSDFLCLS